MFGKTLPDWLAEIRKPAGVWRRPVVWLAGLGLLGLLWAATGGLTGAGADQTVGGEPGATGSLVVDVFVKLGLVLVLVYVSLYLVRRWQGGALGGSGLFAPRARQVTLLETTRLSPRQALHLVRAGSQTFLIGATDQGIALLAEMEPAPLTEGDSRPAAPVFAAALAQAGSAAPVVLTGEAA